jgi:hypothetical protein
MPFLSRCLQMLRPSDSLPGEIPFARPVWLEVTASNRASLLKFNDSVHGRVASVCNGELEANPSQDTLRFLTKYTPAKKIISASSATTRNPKSNGESSASVTSNSGLDIRSATKESAHTPVSQIANPTITERIPTINKPITFLIAL